MCCLYDQCACGINWGIEKCQPCSISARILLFEEGGSTFLRSIRTNFSSKQLKNSPWSWTLLCIRLLPGSNLNTETGYPVFSVSVVFYWICRKIPGFTLIRQWTHLDTFLIHKAQIIIPGFTLITPWPQPDTFLSTRHISKYLDSQ